jgi:hypothetical protein
MLEVAAALVHPAPYIDRYVPRGYTEWHVAAVGGEGTRTNHIKSDVDCALQRERSGEESSDWISGGGGPESVEETGAWRMNGVA